MGETAAATKIRRTQAERRDETRRQILDATVECLIELGYSRTSTLEVQKRAGVSRGALLHHYPSKAGLLVAAVRHLAELRGTELTAKAAALPTGGDRVDAVMDLLWESSNGPLFQVSMELRTAARTDPELREVLSDEEKRLRRDILSVARALFGEEIASKRGFDDAVEMSINLMIGLAMSAALHSEHGQHSSKTSGDHAGGVRAEGAGGPRQNKTHARLDALLGRWKQVFRSLLRTTHEGVTA